MNEFGSLLTCLLFAAQKHSAQRRKGENQEPYINHLIEVTQLLAVVGGINDINVLRAALLHDAIEDTNTTAQEIEDLFNAQVKNLVLEVTDNKSLPKLERKRLQIENSVKKSKAAKQLKLADFISNVKSMPTSWGHERITSYIEWVEKVFEGLRGSNRALEKLLAETLQSAKDQLT